MNSASLRSDLNSIPYDEFMLVEPGPSARRPKWKASTASDELAPPR
jgi:hypothetical protein